MITAYRFQKRGATKCSVAELAKAPPCWVHCVNPTRKELEQIAESSKIPLSDLHEPLDRSQRPRVTELEEYSSIVVRTPNVNKKKQMVTTPVAVFISLKKNNVITIGRKEVPSINKIKKAVEENTLDFYSRGISFFTYVFLDNVFDRYFGILDELEEKIDSIEDVAIKHPDKLTVANIFALKKTLIYFHKALTANREVLTAIEKEYVGHINRTQIKRFRSLYDDVTQLIDMEGTLRDILNGTLEIYLSSVSNNLNHVMKTLTVIASFVLIPTLISGIYGMNFQPNGPYNMPELAWQYGYFFALGLMAFSVLITYMYFKKKKWI